MRKVVLGLDISSSCIGFGVVTWETETNQIQFLDMGYYLPPEKMEGETSQGLIQRVAKARQCIQHLLQEYQPDYIGIEDIIQYMKHKSSAKSIITLAVFNRAIGLLCHDYLGRSPEFFNILGIRHGLKLGNDLPEKDAMPELVAQHLGISFPWTYSKRGKVMVENYDAADGMAVALFLAQNLAGFLPKKKPAKSAKTTKVTKKKAKSRKKS